MDDRFIEVGEATQAAMTAEQLSKVSRAAMPDVDLAPDQYRALECDDCGVELPEFRMKKGFRRCTACQTAREAMDRRRKG
jgi:RNA polymerase-binding transcription factor DksA